MGKREELIGTVFVRLSRHHPERCLRLLARMWAMLVEAEPDLYEPLMAALARAEARR